MHVHVHVHVHDAGHRRQAQAKASVEHLPHPRQHIFELEVCGELRVVDGTALGTAGLHQVAQVPLVHRRLAVAPLEPPLRRPQLLELCASAGRDRGAQLHECARDGVRASLHSVVTERVRGVAGPAVRRGDLMPRLQQRLQRVQVGPPQALTALVQRPARLRTGHVHEGRREQRAI